MRRWLIRLIILCAAAGCTADAGPQGDVVLRRAIRLGGGPTTDAGLIYWGARMSVSDDASRRLIFDLDAKTITFVNKRARTYIVRTLDEMVRKRDQQRQRRDADTSKVALERTDHTDRIAGYDTREYRFETSKAHGAVWVTEAVRPPSVWRDWEAIIAYLEGSFAGGQNILDAVAELNGYPLRTALTFGEGEGAWTLTTQVSEIAPGPPPDDLIVVPAGFQRANDLPMPG